MQAFDWSASQEIRVVLCLHAVPGSQNGWEHSASLDGVAEWGGRMGGNVERAKGVVRFLVARWGRVRGSGLSLAPSFPSKNPLPRYASHPAFWGLEPVNEPTTSGVTFQELSQYYLDCYGILRERSPRAYLLIMGRIFGSDREWDNFMTGGCSSLAPSSSRFSPQGEGLSP